jgi:thiol-disulfide isomerase/thioredoxin
MSVEDLRPILVIVTANGCGACDALKRDLLAKDFIKNIQKSNPEIRVKHINLDDTNSPMPRDSPFALSQAIRWFPSMYLVGGREWNKASSPDMVGKYVSLGNIKCFNGRMGSNNISFEMAEQKQAPSFENLNNWIKNNIREVVQSTVPQQGSDWRGVGGGVSTGDCSRIRIRPRGDRY